MLSDPSAKVSGMATGTGTTAKVSAVQATPVFCDRDATIEKVGRLTRDQVRQIAETKMPDLNARDIEAAMLVVAGTARSMGVETDL